ncbi:MAG: 16S rRNA (guanine(966)-N(2))-methyltransferase RsmD [Deltaproteobacteria bacterium]|nr:16S rRNA (guanine(966)-N(2))-methyltransferase RsmD [Deltaproteobacteria bacterium]
MRIIAGDRKGATLYAPRGMNTRPTSGKVRESLFNQLAHGGLEAGFEGLRILDLFAGSGALGLEALSRGAASAVMVDGDGAALAAMERNIAALRYQDRVRIVRGRLPQALTRLTGSRFDLIFCDPPYGTVDAVALVTALIDARLNAPGATLVWEDGVEHAPALEGLATPVHHRVHGDTVMTVWRLSHDAPH